MKSLIGRGRLTILLVAIIPVQGDVYPFKVRFLLSLNFSKHQPFFCINLDLLLQ